MMSPDDGAALLVGGSYTALCVAIYGAFVVYTYRLRRLNEWRRRAVEAGRACTFCGKSDDEVRGVVPGLPHFRGPGTIRGASICNECTDLCQRILVEEWDREPSEEEDESDLRCSFCGQTVADVQKLIAGPEETGICDGCVSRCAQIFAGH